MKKKLLLLATSLCSISLVVVALFSNVFSSTYKLFADGDDKPAQLSCEYYWNPANEYTSLYELNKLWVDSLPQDPESLETIKTWGTVTKTFYNASGTVAQQFIQSTDANGNVGATCLYGIPSNKVFPEGSVVTVSGDMLLFNGMSEMKNFTILEKDYDINPSPVIVEEIGSDVFLLNNTSDEFNEIRYNGTKKVKITDVSLGSVTSSRQCYATFSDGTDALLFFNSISTKSSIINKINGIIASDNNSANVTGYITCYSSGNTGSPSLQILVRDPDDIEQITVEEKTVSNVEISTDRTFFYKESWSKNDFTVTAHFDDGSDARTTKYEFVDEPNTSVLGEQTINISFTYRGKTVYGSTTIHVFDRVYSISAIDPVTIYASGEEFIMPEVRAYSYGKSFDATEDVSQSGFDSSYEGLRTIEIIYENTAGQTISCIYDYMVDDVSYIMCDNRVTTFEYGDEFVMPTVIANFEDASGDYDVTGRASYSGYDPYQVGTQTVTISFGDESESYTVTVNQSKVAKYITISNAKISYYLDELFVTPTVTVYYDDSSYEDVSVKTSFSGFDSSSIGQCLVTGEYLGLTDSYTVTINPSSEYEIATIPNLGIGTYNTGNYGAKYGFEYYRAVKSSGNLAMLLALETRCSVDTIPASIYNVNPYDDIDIINISYYTADSSGSRSPRVSYGENNYEDGFYELSYSTSLTNVSINLSSYNVNYFRIDGGDINTYINQVTIHYTGNSTPNGDSFVNANAKANSYRIAPVTFNNSYVAGSSYVDVPTSINTSTGEILSTKRYTYYTYDYVSEHPECADDAAMTDPVDVCNYVLAFGCAPANYGQMSGKTVNPMEDGETIHTVDSEMKELFGSKTRAVSQFSRTDGYATAVPHAGSPLNYYELDIDTNGLYSTSSRQVGRIVYWATGFDKASYGNGSQGVCVFTDDHYATFSEYNNYGGFMPRFNAERQYVGRVWSEPTLVTLL